MSHSGEIQRLLLQFKVILGRWSKQCIHLSKYKNDRRNKRGNQSFLEAIENENNTYQNPWHTAKAVLREKFIVMSEYVKRTERSQINDLMLHFKLLEKQQQEKPSTSRRKEIIKHKGQN
jgi:hypothetical protein